MLTLHHLNESRSHRVIWLLEELGLPYRIEPHQRDPQTHLAPESLKRVHPLGKAPVVEHRGRVLAETGAIIATLARGSALLPPEGTEAGDEVRYWLHYAEGSAMPPLVMRLVLAGLPGEAVAPVMEGFVAPDVARQIDWWDRRLSETPWFAGAAFTAADIVMSFPVEMAALRAGAAERPAIRDWLARIHARPAYTRALAAGGPYSGASAS